jgi:response regulator RpfG family c-di-GMP phosphodiesterase
MADCEILIADDDSFVRETVAGILGVLGYRVTAVDSGKAALDTVNERFSVIILDINMPDMDGFQTLEELNRKGLDIPVLFLTGVGTMNNVVRAMNLGAYDFISKPITDPDLFDVKVKRAIEKRRYVLRERGYKEELEREVEAKTRELAETNALLNQYSKYLESAAVNIILTLQSAMEEKDVYTAGHTSRVTQYALKIGRAMMLSEDDIMVLGRAAQLHDIGKLVIDTTSIMKPGPLSSGEWETVRKHPQVGENIISHLDFLHRERQIIRSHHERVDGRGYPHQLEGGELDILTKIITVADSYDAMTSKRGYRKNLTRAEAMEELKRCRNSQFDSEVVRVFNTILENGGPGFSSEESQGIRKIQ